MQREDWNQITATSFLITSLVEWIHCSVFASIETIIAFTRTIRIVKTAKTIGTTNTDLVAQKDYSITAFEIRQMEFAQFNFTIWDYENYLTFPLFDFYLAFAVLQVELMLNWMPELSFINELASLMQAASFGVLSPSVWIVTEIYFLTPL